MLNITPGNWVRQKIGLRWKGPRPPFRENVGKIAGSLLVTVAILALYAFMQDRDEADKLRSQVDRQRAMFKVQEKGD